jgi:FKBP-type peptidyl-prolyl cis-trans isomerase
MHATSRVLTAVAGLVVVILLAGCDGPAKGKLETTDIVVGTGATAQAGDTVAVHYTGRLKNGRVFDSSHDSGEPFIFVLGAGQVIKGWDLGVAGMKEGGKRKLIIPSELAYGERGSGRTIPPNSELEFDVELLKVKAR